MSRHEKNTGIHLLRAKPKRAIKQRRRKNKSGQIGVRRIFQAGQKCNLQKN